MNNTWTDKKPAEIGWYWCRDKQLKKPFVIYVFDLQLITSNFQWVKIPEPIEQED